MKTVILSKSCSRCGGSTILKGQTLQKSIRRVAPNGTGKKNRQKSFPALSPDVLFRSRARFWLILGSRPGAQIVRKTAPGGELIRFGAHVLFFFVFSSLGCVPEGSRTDSGGSGGPPGSEIFKNFTILFCWFLRFFFAGCVPILSGFVGFRRDVAGIRIQTQ